MSKLTQNKHSGNIRFKTLTCLILFGLFVAFLLQSKNSSITQNSSSAIFEENESKSLPIPTDTATKYSHLKHSVAISSDSLKPSPEDYAEADKQNALQDGLLALGQPVDIGPIIFMADSENPNDTHRGKIISLVATANTNVIIGLMRMVYDSENGYFVPTLLTPFSPVPVENFPPIKPLDAQRIVQQKVNKNCKNWLAADQLFIVGVDVEPLYEVACHESGEQAVYYVSALDGAVTQKVTSKAKSEAEPLIFR